MKKFIKENPALATGMFLPIILVILFIAAGLIPKALNDPPKYDLLFTHKKYMNESTEVRVNIINKKPVVEYREGKNDRHSRINLFRYQVKTDSVEEIPINPPTGTDQWQKMDIPQLKDINLSLSTVAPDGFKFGKSRGRRGVFSFFIGGHSNKPVLTKNGYTVPIKHGSGDYYFSGHNIKFVGWIIP